MDILCVVCGESYSSPRDDMEKWEYILFVAGAGCPCCEGVLPEQPFEPKSIEDINNGDEDPLDRLHAYENRKNRPKWEKPADKVLWTCDSCGVEVVEDANGDLAYAVPFKSKAHLWYHSHPFRSAPDDDIAEPYHKFDSFHVCEYCYSACARCGMALAPYMEFGDTYDEGNAFRKEGDYHSHDYFCIDCFEQLCDICQEIPEDCKCGTCVVCGERKCDDDFETGDTCRDCYVEEVEEA